MAYRVHQDGTIEVDSGQELEQVLRLRGLLGARDEAEPLAQAPAPAGSARAEPQVHDKPEDPARRRGPYLRGRSLPPTTGPTPSPPRPPAGAAAETAPAAEPAKAPVRKAPPAAPPPVERRETLRAAFAAVRAGLGENPRRLLDLLQRRVEGIELNELRVELEQPSNTALSGLISGTIYVLKARGINPDQVLRIERSRQAGAGRQRVMYFPGVLLRDA